MALGYSKNVLYNIISRDSNILETESSVTSHRTTKALSEPSPETPSIQSQADDGTTPKVQEEEGKANLRCSKSSSNTCSAKKASLIMRSALLQSTSWHRAIAKGGSSRLKDTQRIWIGAIDQHGKKFIGKSRQGLEIKWNNSESWNETFLRIWEIKSFLSRWKFELIQEYISFELGLIWVF